MLKKKKWFGALSLTLGILVVLASCNLGKNPGNVPSKPDNPSNPDTPPANCTPKVLIEEIAVESGNGFKTVTYKGCEMSVSGNTAMRVTLKAGVKAENAKMTAKLGDAVVEFPAFEIDGRGFASTTLQVLKGVTAEFKEMKIRVTVDTFYDDWNFKIKEFDESSLDTDLKLNSFKIADGEVKDKILSQIMTWRINNPGKDTAKVKMTASFSKDLKSITMIVNGKAEPVELGADRKEMAVEVEFEKNSTKKFSFIFQAEGSRDLNVGPFTLIFTNTVWSQVFVEAGGREQPVNDVDLMSGNVLEYNECTVSTPKIILKAFKQGGRGVGPGKITKVTVDDVEVTINTENQGQPHEEYTATWICNPELATPGESKTVKVHIEGVGFDNAGAEVAKDPWDFSVKFTLVKFIEATLSVKADGNDFEELREGNSKRVYDQNVIIKLATKGEGLTDVVFKDYKDADGKTPDFELNGTEATASVKLADTEFKPSKLKIVAKADGRTDTTFVAQLRYTAKDDPFSVGFVNFRQGDLVMENGKIKLEDGVALMTKERARFQILAGQNVKEITSIKINDKEMLEKEAYTDPLGIIEKATISSISGPGGTSLNALIDIGKDGMDFNKVHEITVSLAGKTADGHNLSEVKLPTFKIKLPDYGNECTDWWTPYTDGSMELIEREPIVYHPDDKAKMFNNYYGVKSFKAAVFPKNPRATVKGFWYKLDGANTEMARIFKDGEGKNSDNWIQFETKDTNYGKCKWCFEIDLDSEKMKNCGIGLFLYVVSADGSKKNALNGNEAGTVRGPLWKLYRKLNVSCSFTKLGNDIGWDDVGDKPGWNKQMQVIDKLDISKENWNKIVDNKLYFRAVTYLWIKSGLTMKYHLFRDKGEGALPTGISDFICLEGTPEYPNFDNRFTLDVSGLEEGQSKIVEIPLYLDGFIQGSVTPFSAKVFTRKFTINRLNQ